MSKSYAEPGPSSRGNGSQTSGDKPEAINNKTDNLDLTDPNEPTGKHKHTFSFDEGINIATHNIRGLSRVEKVQEWIEFCTEANIHIIALSETKLTPNRVKGLTNPIYGIYTSNFEPYKANQRESSLGAALMICNGLQPYIHNVKTIPGTLIMIDLFLPHNNKTRIISIYLPSNHPSLNKKAQDEADRWIREAKSRNWKLFLMGDFNSNQHKNKPPPIFKNLNTLGATSLLDFHNIISHTWTGPSSQSQIDDIWILQDMILEIEKPLLTEATYITGSDHCIISTTWHTHTLSKDINKNKRNKKRKRKVHQYNRMSAEDWNEFTDELGKNLAKKNLNNQITNKSELDRAWNFWAIEIKTMINRKIPFIFTSQRTYHALSLKATKLHAALKNMNKALSLLTKGNPETLKRINELLEKTSKLTDLEIEPININDFTDCRDTIISTLKGKKNTIWTSRNYEKQQEVIDKINFYINRRYEDFRDRTCRMLDSILQRKAEPVRTDKVILPDKILLDKEEILQHIRSHSKTWTKCNPTNTTLENEWEEEYLPLKNILPSIYSNLTHDITLQELKETIENSPNNKAPGPLAIPNEVIKHLPENALHFLLKILNACLQIEMVPDQWLNSNIWLIPKKDRYNYDLNYTRPITLIDHVRKILTKIINNRLITPIMRHEVLSPLNFAAFPGQSTSQPLSNLTHILEDARTGDKEIWALAQDMSKAFDTVHVPTLEKALKRIKIPKEIICLLLYLLTNRKNRVITDLGITRPYEVEDGIDQGETFSPLLWKIYYDPLISRIQRSFQGYTGSIPTNPPRQIHMPVMAYMDDSLWLAHDKTTLTNIISLATSFYKYNNIRVNPSKSYLITNTKKERTPTIEFDNSTIYASGKDTPIKYLGAWFTAGNSPHPVQRLLLAEIQMNLKKLRLAKITEKQAIYIINRVIFPRLQYRLHSVYLKPSQIKKINRICISIVKQKGGLARGIPNSFIYNPEIYGLDNLLQVHDNALISLMSKNLNHKDFDKSFLKMRIQQLQEAANTEKSILSHTPIFPHRQNSTHTAQSITAGLSLGITWNKPLNQWPILPNRLLGTSIDQFIIDHPKRHILKEKMNRHGIYCVEQLLDLRNKNFLSWAEIHHNIQKIPRGRPPNWLYTMQEILSGNANPTTTLITPNPFTLTPWTRKGRKNWIITKDEEFAKITSFSQQYPKAKHYTITTNNKLEACTGCTLKDKSITGEHCYFSLRDRAYGLQVDSRQIIHGKISDIYAALNNGSQPLKEPNLEPLTLLPRPLSAFVNPPVDLWESLIRDNFKKRNLSIHLSTIKDNHVVGSTTYSSYIATAKLSTKDATLGSTNRIWPSRLHSILTMLIFLLSTVSSNTVLQILTNHRRTVETVQKMIKLESYKLDQLNKEDYPSLLRILKGLIGDRKVTIKLDSELNIQKPSTIHNLDINPKHFVYNTFTMELLNNPCILQTKLVLKNINRITNLLRWFNQQRIHLWESYMGNIQWNLVLKYISYADKPAALYTHPSLSQIKNFKVKMIAEELPTHLILHYRNPNKNPNYLCPRCYVEPEDIVHIFTCISNHLIWERELRRTLLRVAVEIESPLENPDEFIKSFTFLHLEKKMPFGLITNSTLFPTSSRHIQDRYTPLLHHEIVKTLYKEYWIPSRASRHSEGFPKPPQINPPNMTQTPPLVNKL